MFQRLGDHISINKTEQEVPLKPMSKPAGNNIKFPSHLWFCGRGKVRRGKWRCTEVKSVWDESINRLKLTLRELKKVKEGGRGDTATPVNSSSSQWLGAESVQTTEWKKNTSSPSFGGWCTSSWCGVGGWSQGRLVLSVMRFKKTKKRDLPFLYGHHSLAVAFNQTCKLLLKEV